MNISEKIEDIRRQPQHVRLRWVWMCVAASMFLIMIIWFFSIATLFKKEDSSNQAADENISTLKNQLNDVKKQSPSLKDYPTPTADNTGTTDAQSTPQAQTSDDFQYPASSGSAEVPASQSYSTQQ